MIKKVQKVKIIFLALASISLVLSMAANCDDNEWRLDIFCNENFISQYREYTENVLPFSGLADDKDYSAFQDQIIFYIERQEKSPPCIS